MKNTLRYLCALIVVMCALPVFGQDYLTVHFKDGSSKVFSVIDNPSLSCSKKDGSGNVYPTYVSHVIRTDDETYYYSIESVDSIVFARKELLQSPTTKEDVKESVKRTESIISDAKAIVDSLKMEGPSSADDVAHEFLKLPDVVYATPTEDGNVTIFQNDGLQILYLLQNPVVGDAAKNEEKAIQQRRAFSQPPLMKASGYNNGVFLAKPKKAVILSAYQEQFHIDLTGFSNALLDLGVNEVDVFSSTDPNLQNHPDYTKFKGDFLQQYDIICIFTHGGVTGTYKNSNIFQSIFGSDRYEGTVFMTTTPYNVDEATKILERKELSQIVVAVEGDDTRLAMTTDYIKDTSFDNSLVFVFACSSAKATRNSIMDTFMKNNALGYCGYLDISNDLLVKTQGIDVIKTMASTLSFQESCEAMIKSDAIKRMCDLYKGYIEKSTEWCAAYENGKMSYESFQKQRSEIIASTTPDLLTYRVSNRLNGSHLYYFNPALRLNMAQCDGENVSLSWDCDLSGCDYVSRSVFEENSEWFTVNERVQIRVEYDVYIDGNKLGKSFFSDSSDKKASCKVGNGRHVWRVVANVLDENRNVLATHYSDERPFEVTFKPVTSLTITEPTTTMTVGEVRSIEYHFEPLDPTNRTMEWSSSDPSIVRIGQDAIAYALKPGTCTITVRTTDGSNLSATCRVTVQEEEKPQPQHYLRVYNYDYSIGADGGTVTLDYDSDVDCNLRTNVDWIVGGAGKIVTIKKNTTGDSRKGKVIIENKEYGFTETVTIIQQAGNAPEPQHYITLSESEYRVAAAGGSFTLQYQSDVACTITASENWMSVQGTKVTVSPNTTTNRRTGYVTIANDVYGLSQKVTVIQEPNEEPQHYITLTETEYHVMGTGGRFVVQYKSDVACVISSTVDWITTEGVIITVRPNNTPYRRTGYVTIVNDVYGLSQSVPVIQEPGDDAPQTDGTLLATKTVGGKSYSLFRTQDKNRRRTNPDGTSFYRSKFTLKVADQTFEIDDDVYMHEGVGDDASVCMAYNSSTRTTYMFVTSKDGDEGVYSMEGYLYAISSSGKITKNVVYTYANWGWHPFFLLSDYGDLYLASFSYAGYFYTLGYVEADGSCEFVPIDYIYPEDFQELRRREGGILVY